MYRQGDIVKVPFPLSDDTGSKVRPAIIISNKAVNDTQDVVMAQITAKPRNDAFSFFLKNEDMDTPLPCPSQVRCHKITVIQKTKIIKHISRLKVEKQRELLAKITALLHVY